MVFPIRGHSYLECDRDMGKINSKFYTKLPDDGRNIFLQGRQNPTPFNVIDCAIEVEFKTWTDYFSDLYPTKNSIPTRPIRVLLIEESKPRFINHKFTYHGPYLSAVITRATNKRNRKNKINKNTTLRPLYDGTLPIKKAKLNDLLYLKQFLTNSNAQQFYAALKSDETDRDDVDVEYADNIPIDEN